MTENRQWNAFVLSKGLLNRGSDTVMPLSPLNASRNTVPSPNIYTLAFFEHRYQKHVGQAVSAMFNSQLTQSD